MFTKTGLWRIVLAVIVISACAAQKRPARKSAAFVKGGRMTEILRQKTIAEPVPVSYTVRPLTSGAEGATRPAAREAESPTYWRYLGSAAQNSRLPGVFGRRSWRVRWSFPALPSAPATAILRHSDRILLQYLGGWALLDGDGRKVASGQAGRGALAMDPKLGFFYVMTVAGAIEARQLSNGAVQFQNALPYDESYAWPLIVRDGARLIAFGNELPVPSHRPEPPRESIIQLMELAQPLKVDQYKLLQSLKRFESLHVLDPKLIAAVSGSTIHAAGSNLILQVSTSLEIQAAYSGDFQPLLVSLDEAGWMYLFAQVKERKSVMVLTPDGREVLAIPLSHEDENLELPPLVGYDHRIYLVTSEHVIAHSQDGKLLWRQFVPGRIAGAGVTVDGIVLVSAGSQVQAIHPDGSVAPVFRFEGEEIVSPPVYTSDHDLLVSTRKQVYCLSGQ
jgi:hypothetical protein